MVKFLAGLSLVVTTVALGAPAVAAPSPELVKQAEVLVSGYEHVPKAADWARLGAPEDVAAALMTLARERKAITAARATAMLGHFPRPEVRAFLEARIADAMLRPTLRGKAAIALARAFGDAATPAIAPLLASADPDLREDAIRAFGPLASTAAERFMRARADKDPLPRLAERMRTTADRIAVERARRLLAVPAGGLDPDRGAPTMIVDPGPVGR